MKLLVCGSRSYTNYRAFERIMDAFFAGRDGYAGTTEIISGGARGADSLASIYCKRRNIPNTVMLPDWKNLGKGAGFARNLEMLAVADEVIAFWDGKSPGTKHTIDAAGRVGLRVTLVVDTGGEAVSSPPTFPREA